MTNQKAGRRSPDQAADGGSGRYGSSDGARGSGHQESKKPERKDARGFVSRQGGDQSEHGRSQGEPEPRGPRGKADH